MDRQIQFYKRIVRFRPYIIVEYEETDDYYVDSYIHLPLEVRKVIAGYVSGYSMPGIGRYGPDIYPDAGPRDYENLPSYIKADFNGDGYADYACMFSRVNWSGNSWFLKTKMVVVVSGYGGYSLSAEYDLGTVSGRSDVAVEEYWGIRLLRKGTHTITIYSGNSGEKASFFLENDGIYLGSMAPEERTVFYITGKVLHEFALDMGAVAKKRVLSAQERANRVIPISGDSY